MFLTQRIFDDMCKEYNLTPCPALVVIRSSIGRGLEVDEGALRSSMSISNYGR